MPASLGVHSLAAAHATHSPGLRLLLDKHLAVLGGVEPGLVKGSRGIVGRGSCVVATALLRATMLVLARHGAAGSVAVSSSSR